MKKKKTIKMPSEEVSKIVLVWLFSFVGGVLALCVAEDKRLTDGARGFLFVLIIALSLGLTYYRLKKQRAIRAPWIKDEKCVNTGEYICNLGYACDGCPFNKEAKV